MKYTYLLFIIIIFICIFIYVGIMKMEMEMGMKMGMGMGMGMGIDKERFQNYKEPYYGYCKPTLSKKEFANGDYKMTRCLNNQTIEVCQTNYCGIDKNGKQIPCTHSMGSCKNDPMCYQSCYHSGLPCDSPTQFNENDMTNFLLYKL